MADVNTDPFNVAQISKDLLAAQQKFLPFGKSFEQFSEAAKIISAAQVAYGKEIMRANAVLFGKLFQAPGSADSEIRPSVSAKARDYAA